MELVKFLLMSKTQSRNDGKAKFKKFFTSVDIIVEGEEEKGEQPKTLTVRFDKSIDTKDFQRGIITCKEEDIDIPYKWRVIEKKQADGSVKNSYPYIYVKKVQSYEPRKTKSTAKFNLLDEAETEEVEITDEEN